jgi:hypothetical protein
VTLGCLIVITHDDPIPKGVPLLIVLDQVVPTAYDPQLFFEPLGDIVPNPLDATSDRAGPARRVDGDGHPFADRRT